MNYIREKFKQSDYCLGMWCNMGSSISVEMISLIGFDWVLIDLEHGPSDQDSLLHLLQPLSNSDTAPIVRIAWNDDSYYKNANNSLLTIVQIETEEAVETSREIAGVEGIDVLFVGPLDLSVSLGVPGDYDSSIFTKAIEKVQKSAEQAGKKAGILVSNEKKLKDILDLGFTFIAYGSDSGLLVNGMKKNKEIFDKLTLSGKIE